MVKKTMLNDPDNVQVVWDTPEETKWLTAGLDEPEETGPGGIRYPAGTVGDKPSRKA